MTPNTQLRSTVRLFYMWLAAVSIFAASPFVATWLVRVDTPTSRAAAVIVGAGGMLPWLAAVFFSVRRGDEFVRQIHLIACAYAFAGALVLVSALTWMVRAKFIAPPELALVWISFLLMWLVAFAFARRSYERMR